MKNTILISAVLSLAMLSCNKKSSTTTHADANQITNSGTEKTVSFVVDSVKIEDSTKISGSLSAKYNKSWLVFPTIKNTAVLDSIYGSALKDFSKEGIKAYLMQDKAAYFAQSKAESSDFDTANMELSVDEKMQLVSNANGFLQIKTLSSSYTGGAHGNYGTAYTIIDLQNNRKVHLTDIVNIPEAQLKAILHKNIDKIPSGASDENGDIPNSDMLLEKDFGPNSNIYFDDKNLYFSYVPYEIAAFAAGQITIPVSWSELKPYIRPKFSQRINIK